MVTLTASGSVDPDRSSIVYDTTMIKTFTLVRKIIFTKDDNYDRLLDTLTRLINDNRY